MDFDIETVSDVLPLLFKLNDQIDMKVMEEKEPIDLLWKFTQIERNFLKSQT